MLYPNTTLRFAQAPLKDSEGRDDPKPSDNARSSTREYGISINPLLSMSNEMELWKARNPENVIHFVHTVEYMCYYWIGRSV